MREPPPPALLPDNQNQLTNLLEYAPRVLEAASRHATRTLRCRLSAGRRAFTDEKPRSSSAAAVRGSPVFLRRRQTKKGGAERGTRGTCGCCWHAVSHTAKELLFGTLNVTLRRTLAEASAPDKTGDTSNYICTVYHVHNTRPGAVFEARLPTPRREHTIAIRNGTCPDSSRRSIPRFSFFGCDVLLLWSSRPLKIGGSGCVVSYVVHGAWYCTACF